MGWIALAGYKVYFGLMLHLQKVDKTQETI